VGIKICLVPLGIKIDTLLSLLVTLGILAGGVIFSLYRTRNEPDISAEEQPRTGQLEP
jgi:tellurite resistance protein TerC